MSGQRYKLSFEKHANHLFNSETCGFHCGIHAVNFAKMDFTDLRPSPSHPKKRKPLASKSRLRLPKKEGKVRCFWKTSPQR